MQKSILITVYVYAYTLYIYLTEKFDWIVLFEPDSLSLYLYVLFKKTKNLYTQFRDF